MLITWVGLNVYSDSNARIMDVDCISFFEYTAHFMCWFAEQAPGMGVEFSDPFDSRTWWAEEPAEHYGVLTLSLWLDTALATNVLSLRAERPGEQGRVRYQK